MVVCLHLVSFSPILLPPSPPLFTFHPHFCTPATFLAWVGDVRQKHCKETASKKDHIYFLVGQTNCIIDLTASKKDATWPWAGGRKRNKKDDITAIREIQQMSLGGSGSKTKIVSTRDVTVNRKLPNRDPEIPNPFVGDGEL